MFLHPHTHTRCFCLAMERRGKKETRRDLYRLSVTDGHLTILIEDVYRYIQKTICTAFVKDSCLVLCNWITSTILFPKRNGIFIQSRHFFLQLLPPSFKGFKIAAPDKFLVLFTYVLAQDM